MRILAVGNMYPPHYLGGYELMWESGVSALRGRGDQVRVLTTDFRLGEREETDPDVHRELRWYWQDHDFPKRGLRERLDLERHNAGVLEGHLADFRPDLVSWWAMGGMSLSLIERVRRTGLPAVGVVGDDWMLYGPEVDAWMKLWRRVPGRSAAGIPTRVDLGAAAHWLFISRILEEDAGRVQRLPRTEVAHPGVDPGRFAPALEQPWAWRLACLGRIDDRKGLDVAVKALAELPAEATLTLDGGGDAAYAERLANLASALGVADRLRVLRSPHDAVPRAYAAADAVLFPVVWREPWGLVPLEAMAVGRPVAATGLGGSGEYLRDGQNCLLVDPGDPTSLVEAVRRLAEDADLRARLRKGGHATAARFSAAAFYNAVTMAHARVAREAGPP